VDIPPLSSSPFLLAALLLGAFGIILVLAGLVALFRARLVRFTVRTLAGLLLISLGALAGGIALGVQGYQALTREEVAARLFVRPSGNQRFAATFRYPDGREVRFDIGGDEIYVDAHILKWKPIANVLGLHTSYEFGRIAGRYRDLEQERSSPRTVYSLAPARPVNLFDLRQRYAFLGNVVDAEYGSATFVPVTAPAELEVRVSTTGLLMREAPAAQ
jgi:hypothetical protein